jgi:hypothetical protein
MSFEGMGKSIQKGESADRVVGAPFHPLDEFPASYSLTRCSPAELVSASPAENDFTGERIQLRGFFINRKSKNAGHESTLNTLFFGPKNGEPLSPRLQSDAAVSITTGSISVFSKISLRQLGHFAGSSRM